MTSDELFENEPVGGMGKPVHHENAIRHASIHEHPYLHSDRPLQPDTCTVDLRLPSHIAATA